MEGSERTWTAGRRRDVAAGLVTLLIALVAGYGSWQAWDTQRDLQALVACQSQVNTELRQAGIAVRRSDVEQLSAQLDLLTTPRGDPAAGEAALAQFIEQLRQALASREANPFPTRDC